MGKLVRILLSAVLIAAAACAQAEESTNAARHDRLLAEVQAMARAAGDGVVPSTISPAVIEAMRRVPRHEFVPERARDRAYENRPLPIGYGQTISQPYIVALMTELLQIVPGASVLEVGTGSGYQAAVLAELKAKTHTIEIIPELGRTAARQLERLGYDTVQVRIGDGYHGWPEAGPFDSIVVTAAASHIPPPLVRQLKPGGRMVIPLGGPFTVQHLMLVIRHPDGSVGTRQLLPVVFVPLTGGR